MKGSMEEDEMRDEERELLNKVTDEVDSAIDKVFKDFGYDRSYFNFKLSVELLDENFHTVGIRTLIDEDDLIGGYCKFCKKRSFYYDTNIGSFLCVECYTKLYPT